MASTKRLMRRGRRSPLQRFSVIAVVLGIFMVSVTNDAVAWGHSRRDSAHVFHASSGIATSSLPQRSTHATVSTTTTVPMDTGGLIIAGPSRSRCLEPNLTGVGFAKLSASISAFEAKTHSVVTCVSAYLNGASTWTDWSHPWVASKRYGFSTWVSAQPKTRQLVLGIDLIPTSLSNVKNPLLWEKTCAAGKYNAYATQMGRTLVAAKLGDSVLRLGPEMNGTWERDFIGFTAQEQRLWAQCFANEVTSLRKVPGQKFLIDWNPNACVEDIPFWRFYPGNQYVDILGLDLFDQSCVAPYKVYTFEQLAHEPASLSQFEKFATAKGKPMSLPEWALSAVPLRDDPGYISGIGSTVANGNFAFESYFDFQTPEPLLGPKTPKSLVAFHKWFGSPPVRGSVIRS